MQFDLLPEDEGILAAISTRNLIEELVEMKSWATAVGKTLGEELNRTSTILVPKLRAELEESTNSLKAALEAVEACREKMRRDELTTKELQEVLKAHLTKVEAERDQLLKEKVDVEKKEKSLTAEMEKCQEFMLRINEESFYQGI